MARTRLLKPDFFTDEDLADLPFEARLLFAGLWTLADREGRLEDRPKRIKAQLFPYDDIKIDVLLSRLASAAFIVRYVVDDVGVIEIRTFVKHQHPHHKEPASALPGNPNKFEKSRKSRGKYGASLGQGQGVTPTLPQHDPSDTDTDTDTDTLDPDTDTDTDTDTSPATVVAETWLDRFDRFWDAYPKKKAKADALKAWKRLKPSAGTTDAILAAVARQRQSEDWLRSGGQFIPYPATWLNRQQWLDEGVEGQSHLSETARHNLAAAEEALLLIQAWDARRDD